MIDLISLEEAKHHLHLTGERYDVDIQNKIWQASAILFNYLKIDPDESPLSVPWAGDDIPWDIKASCALIVGELHMNREGSTANVLSDTVRALLHRWRDPAIA